MANDLDRLKRKARQALLRYYRERDGLTCGAHLAEYVSPDVSQAKREFNALMDEIAELDPSCPTERL